MKNEQNVERRERTARGQGREAGLPNFSPLVKLSDLLSKWKITESHHLMLKGLGGQIFLKEMAVYAHEVFDF